MSLDTKIEAILFFKGEPVSFKNLSDLLEVSGEEIEEGVKALDEKLRDRGVRLIYKDDKLALGTMPEAGELIEKITKEEFSKDLGKAGLETLSIVLYQGPISRNKIDYIRGVNSSFILRNLMIRGLVERVPNPEDQRSYLYKPTFDLLAFLGINKIEDLPEYQNVKESLEDFVKNEEDDDKETQFQEKNLKNDE